MAAKAIYKANDDTEHRTAEEAEAHNEMLLAGQRLNEAVKGIERILKKKALTADGVSLLDIGWRAYRIAANHYGDFPRMYPVYLSHCYCDLDTDVSGDGSLVVRQWESEGNKYVTHRLDQLYAKETNAKKAWVEACKKRMQEHTEEFERLTKHTHPTP